MTGTQAQASTVDPAKLLEKVRRWCPAAPVEVPITLVKSFIEAAASGGLGQLRLGLLEDYVLGLDGELCAMRAKINKLKKETVRMAGDRRVCRNYGQVAPRHWRRRLWQR